jgi:hypothetical protein
MLAAGGTETGSEYLSGLFLVIIAELLAFRN